MATVSTNWDSTWTATSIASSTITNTSNATTSAIDNSGKAGSEVSVTVAYASGTVNSGVIVSILRFVNDTPSYESGSTDNPFSFSMPFSSGSTYNRTVTVPADRVSKYKVYISNNSGVSVTCTVDYKQFTIQIV